MKVRIMTTLLALALSGTIRAQSITLVAPNGGESWKLGTNQNIVWTFTGIPNGTPVKLVLFRNNDKIGQIVENISIGVGGAGMYSWKVGNWEGGTATAGGGYKLRIRDMNGAYPADDGNNPFTITLGMTAGLNEGVAELNPLHIIDPTKESIWTIDEIHTIHWAATEKVKYPLWLFLVTADKKLPVVDIGKSVPLGNFRPMEKSWIVTDNLYTEEYRIRITSADNEYYAYSMPFLIKATKITAFNVLPASVANKVGWHKRHSYEDSWIAVGEAFTSGDVLTPVANPGGFIIKYGYQRWYQDSDNNEQYLHRSLVSFDLGAVISKLKHKATVKSAYIDWKKAGNSPQACAPNIFCLDAHMPNVDAMFGQAFVAFPKHLLTGGQQIQIQMAQRWLDDPSKNYGLVVGAVNEGQPHETGQCVTFGDNVVMKLEIEEKLNK